MPNFARKDDKAMRLGDLPDVVELVKRGVNRGGIVEPVVEEQAEAPALAQVGRVQLGPGRAVVQAQLDIVRPA